MNSLDIFIHGLGVAFLSLAAAAVIQSRRTVRKLKSYRNREE